jgi:hypothetical protein
MSEPIESPPASAGIPARGLNDGASRSLQLLTESLVRQMRAYSPLRLGLSPAEQAAHQARTDEANRKRAAEAEASFDAAHADWEATCALLAGNRPAFAALDVHEPECGYGVAECSECRESDGYEDVAAVAWPCGTYTAIKEAA